MMFSTPLTSLFGLLTSASFVASLPSQGSAFVERQSVSTYTPVGAVFKDFAVKSFSKNARAPSFFTDDAKARTATAAYIVIHGRLRDGWNYWELINQTLSTAVDDGVPGVSQDSFIIAPQFFSEEEDKGKYTGSELAYSNQGWSGGAVATHPTGTNVSSIDVLDALVTELNNKKKYPKIAKLICIGHGGGGQLMQRYAVLGEGSSRIPIRYVFGDASSAIYFTSDRPATLKAKKACPTYQDFRYGLHGWNGSAAGGLKTAKQYFKQYITREVVEIVGYQDTSAGGDQSCGATVQGGQARRDRNLSFWKYINTLARTEEDVSGFPGNFSTPIPDWSSISNGTINHRLVVVTDAAHDAVKVFASPEGQSALFGLSKDDILQGWRPNSTATTTTASEPTTAPTSTASDTSTATSTLTIDDT